MCRCDDGAGTAEGLRRTMRVLIGPVRRGAARRETINTTNSPARTSAGPELCALTGRGLTPRIIPRGLSGFPVLFHADCVILLSVIGGEFHGFSSCHSQALCECINNNQGGRNCLLWLRVRLWNTRTTLCHNTPSHTAGYELSASCFEEPQLSAATSCGVR